MCSAKMLYVSTRLHLILFVLLYIILPFGPVGSQSVTFENLQSCAVIIARYVVYLLLIKGLKETTTLTYNYVQKKQTIRIVKILERSRIYILVFVNAVGLLIYTKEKIFGEEFLFIFIAYLISKYPELDRKVTINYGTGMACSFFEGYLVHIIPSDGGKFVGFQENINAYEAKQGVVFPVKRLFIVITKSLYCPPDLKHFNKNSTDLPYLEACRSLEDVEKDVAGVKNRTYRNSAYKIFRPGGAPVYLSAECATPLHTLHRVLKNALYEELAHVDPAELVQDFCAMLSNTISKCPETRGKCELVYFDDTDPSQNLADVLLDKIRELEPNFENIKRL